MAEGDTDRVAEGVVDDEDAGVAAGDVVDEGVLDGVDEEVMAEERDADWVDVADVVALTVGTGECVIVEVTVAAVDAVAV